MANVSFKRGLSTALSGITVEDGVFYLTTDTHRLYVGQGSDLAELNQSVTTYATWADMEQNAPKQKGQFYYAIQENVLACYLPELNKWQQINPDHNDNDDTYVSSLTVAPDKSETGKLKYTITVGQKTKHNGKEETTVTPDITGYLEISSEDLNTIASDVAVGVKTDAIVGNENGFVFKTTGGGADADTNIAIVGGDNVNVDRSEDGKTITIKSTDTNTTYDLLSNAGDAKITLHGTDNADRTVSFVGAQQIEVSGTNEREIVINHKDSSVTAGDYNSSIEIKDNKFTVPSFTVDQQGHITSASTNELTIPASHDTKTSIKSISAGEDGKITIVYAEDAEAQTVSSNAELYYQITVDGNPSNVNNRGLLGEFYSSGKVDELIRQAAAGMNAMTYKGVVDSDNFATKIVGAQKGDTYKANGEIVIGSQTTKTGDLIIYNGDDLATDGIPDNANFDVIPSGDEIDSQFKLSGADNAIVLTNTTSKNTAGSVNISGADGISAEVAGNTLSIKHTNAIATGAGSIGENSNVSPAAGETLKIPNISYDAQGHITNASDITITLPADKDTTYSLGTTVGDAQYDAYINLTPAAGSGADVTSAKFKAGANIAITGSGTEITVGHTGPGNVNGNAIGDNTETALNYEGKFIVPKITKDANGHIVSAEDVELTLPKAVAIPTMNYAGATTLDEKDTNRVIMSSSLTIGTTAAQTYAPSIGSSTLALSISGNAITMDLEWGSF